MFYVIQIGNEFYVTFRGKDLPFGTIETGLLVNAKRFVLEAGAENAADLIRANETVKLSVTVKKCGIIQ